MKNMRHFRTYLLVTLLLLTAGQGAWGQDPASIGSIQYNSTLGAYEINSVANLNDLAVYVNGSGTYSTSVEETTAHDCSGLTFKQTADIDMQGVSYTPIGNDELKPFKGTYDGDGYFVKNISHSISGANNHSGFVGRLEGTVKNVNLKDCNFTAYRAGGIAGGLGEGSVIQSCNVIGGTITGTDTNPQSSHGSAIGGIVGYNYKQQAVDNCFVTAAFSGDARDKGPVVGRTSGEASSIINCYYVNTPGGNTIGTQVTVYAITLGDGITVTGNFRTVGKTATNTYYFGKEGDVITLNKAGFSGTYYVNDEAIVGNTFTMPAADVTITDSDWRDLQALLTNASTDAAHPTVITLDKDIVATGTDSYLNVPAGHHVIIDLNGHTINRNLTEANDNGYVFYVRGGTDDKTPSSLTIRDSQGGGTITGGYASGYNGGGAFFVTHKSTLTIEGGTITGNKSSKYGGGAITISNSTVRMTGGSITGNVGNTSNNDSFYAAGAVCLKEQSHFYFSGGSITGNLCGGHTGDIYGKDDCGGIGFDNDHPAYVNRVHLSGTYTLSGNLLGSYSDGTLTNSIASDYLHTQKNVIVIADAISPTAPAVITVSDKSKQTGFTSGWGNHMTADPATCFTLGSFYNTDGKGIYLVSDELYITTPEALYWHADADHDGTTEERAYIISTPAGLDYLASVVNYDRDCGGLFFRLGADVAYDPDVLDANGENYTAIGSWILVGNNWFPRRFEGTFNGDGHTVSGIRIHKTGNTDGDKYQGLFGEMGLGSTVKNVIVSDAVISGSTYVGGIAGASHGIIENCRVTATVTVSANDCWAGGILGHNNNGTVRGCTSAATVSGEYGIGGIAGYISNSSTIASIEDCLAIGASITATDDHGGAIVGRNNCYSGNYLSILSNNYYSGCTVTNGSGPAQTRGVGCGNQADGTNTPTDVTTMTVNNVTYTNCAVPAPADPGLTLVQGTKDNVTAWWGTYYNGSFSYSLPEGAAAYTMDKDHHLYRLGTDGRKIPAGVAVVIIADKRDITLTLSPVGSTITDHAPGGNRLEGSDSGVQVSGGKVNNKTPHVLSVVGGVVGFYPLASNYNDVIPAHKAYYVE